MPLIASNLATSLEREWLVPDGGSFPSSVAESGDRFAGCVARWFATGLAAGLPCSTATARQAQLAGSATAAFSAQSAASAGALLGSGLALYMTGQLFGAGAALPPAGVSAAISAYTSVFSNVNLPNNVRAQQMAQAAYTLALTTIVVFPLPPGPPPAPVT